ncbi:uncharacterized protein LOC127751527 [Frankliniella occidentalis]|uniref:Uncharacterized protein LOC127751527 n=1 Tax=Frankliniella occidentalis TaxID=133901 RepID=A0A9C6X8S4_FRAOC|nr:uncharacterized protein LOC127751527 [Frankliniella occidentalis]
MAFEIQRQELYGVIRELSETVQVRNDLRNLADTCVHLSQFTQAIMNQPLAELARPGLQSLQKAVSTQVNYIIERTLTAAGRNLCIHLLHRILHDIHSVRQRVGDVLYVLPFAIHWGVNLGFTVNEAVNCSSKSWLRSGLISRPMCRCPTVPQSMQTVKLDGVLVAAGATPQMIERWMYGQHLEVMATLDVRNPYSGKQGACPVDITLLLGKDQKDYDLDCKELTSIMAPFAGHQRGEYIGGLVCLDDDDDELKENDICNEDEEQDMRHETDQLSSRLDYKCPFPCKCLCECTCECGYAAKTQGQPGLTALTSHIHVNHKQHPQYHTILQEVIKKYDKTLREGNYLVCELCHERVAQNGKSDFNLKRHQASSKCQRKRGQGPLQPSTSKQKGQKRKFDTD